MSDLFMRKQIFQNRVRPSFIGFVSRPNCGECRMPACERRERGPVKCSAYITVPAGGGCRGNDGWQPIGGRVCAQVAGIEWPLPGSAMCFLCEGEGSKHAVSGCGQVLYAAHHHGTAKVVVRFRRKSQRILRSPCL